MREVSLVLTTTEADPDQVRETKAVPEAEISGCVKKLNPFKFKLSASCCIDLKILNCFELMMRKDARSCTYGNYMTLLFISNV